MPEGPEMNGWMGDSRKGINKSGCHTGRWGPTRTDKDMVMAIPVDG